MHRKFSVLVKKKINRYNKKITINPDKSITHRCYFIASQCLGISKIKGLDSEDVHATINALRLLGIKIVKKKVGYFMFMALQFQVLKSLPV